jgi:hypothetical protein
MKLFRSPRLRPRPRRGPKSEKVIFEKGTGREEGRVAHRGKEGGRGGERGEGGKGDTQSRVLFITVPERPLYISNQCNGRMK